MAGTLEFSYGREFIRFQKLPEGGLSYDHIKSESPSLGIEANFNFEHFRPMAVQEGEEVLPIVGGGWFETPWFNDWFGGSSVVLVFDDAGFSYAKQTLKKAVLVEDSFSYEKKSISAGGVPEGSFLYERKR